jgi:DNA-binding transcriptional ArsR family regulator
MHMRAGMQVSDKPTGELMSEQVDVAVSTFSLLAEATRVRLLWCLLRGEYAVTELSAMTGAAPSAVSQHLAKLRLARLVRHRRSGRQILYSADNSHVRRLLEEALYHADHVAQGHADHP